MLDRRAAEVLLDGARGQARPRFDLTFSVGYEGSATGERWEPLFQPLYRNIPGVRASLQVDYQQPFANAAARGFALQRAALHEQQRVIEADLTLRVRSGIAVSSEALHSSARAADEAARAVELHRKTVDNERRKNQLGAATLLDVILAEDRWTSALLDEVATRLDFALALASLRFESGTMVAGERGTLDVNVDQLLKPF
jgi:outer membrane protein TolC